MSIDPTTDAATDAPPPFIDDAPAPPPADAGSPPTDAAPPARCAGQCVSWPIDYTPGPSSCPAGTVWDGVGPFSSSCTGESGSGICCLPAPTGDAGTVVGGGPLIPCGPSTCTSGQVCVHRVETIGACRRLADLGVTACPAGQVEHDCAGAPGCFAAEDFFWCAEAPTSCGTALDCSCASSLCDPGGPRACATTATCTGSGGRQLDCFCEQP
jgi:hypothetical protein